ncbi:hypothetical protein ABPG75_002667 [Micractinium tetrahymenae]
MVKVSSIPGPSLLDVPDKNIPTYNDFRMAQIKSLAFLTVIARSQNLQPLMHNHKDAICSAIVRVMQTVPDVLSTRKELLIALRNILPTPFSRTCIEGLRPLAYSTLAELVASCKSELSYDQLAKVVHVFARVAHDCTIPAVLQSTSLRLLYNLIETIFQRRADSRTSELYRSLLSSVLECFVRKLGTLRTQVARIVKEMEASRSSAASADLAAGACSGAAAEECEAIAPPAQHNSKQGPGLEHEAFPVLLPSLVASPREKEVSEFRSLLQTVFSCLKSVLYCMVAFHTNRGLQAPLSFPAKTWSTRAGDVRIVSRLITFGLPALAFYEAAPHPSVDMREQFADLFTVLQDGRDFADVVSPKLPLIFEMATSNRFYLHVIRHLVEGDTAARSGVNRYMIALLLQFIVAEKKLDVLQDPVSKSGQLVADVLEMCFSMLPRIQLLDVQKAQQLAQLGIPQAERVLLPHILDITKAMLAGLSWAGAGQEACMRLLRSLFYNMALGKFLDVQAAFGHSGLHAKLVDASLDLLHGPSATPIQGELAAELCLLAPARLEHLIPPMPRMMHAVLRALRGTDQSVSVALKVLDLWVDSFNPEFIERSMAGVIRNLMLALWAHIQPHPNPHGTKVAEIMGKLGGRSRQWLLDGLSNEYKSIPEYGLRIILAFSPRTSFLVPLDRCVQFAAAAIKQGTSLHQQQNAVRLVHVCLATLMKVALPRAVAMERGVVFTALQECLFRGKVPDVGNGSWSDQLGVKTKKQHLAEQNMLVSLLLTTMATSNQAGARDFAHNACRHFALLLASGWATQQAPALPPSSKYASYPVLGGMPAKVTALKHLHPHAILEALQEGFALQSMEERDAVLGCMAAFLDALGVATSTKRNLPAQAHGQPGNGVPLGGFGAQAAASSADAEAPLDHYGAIVADLAARAVHCCYGGHWSSRLGGIAALEGLVPRLPASALHRLAPVAAKAAFAVLRILPEGAVEEQKLGSVLQSILQRCGCDGASREAETDAAMGEAPVPAEHEPHAATASSGSGSKPERQHLPALPRQMVEIFVQQVLSSRSSMAVRAVAAAGLQTIANSRGSTMAELLKPIMKAFDSILERRLLPIRSINTQANHAHSVAFILRTCSMELALRIEPVLYIADACSAMEMSDAAISATATFRGAPVRTEAIVRLRIACLQVLTAAIGWQAFREAESMPAQSAAPTEAAGDGSIKLAKLRERLLKVLIMELGSTHESIIDVAKGGVLLALEHNMLPKPILQEALRPILTDLAFYNRINLRLLRHLHRLLDLLSGQFNVTLGDKLSEHLKKWIDVTNVLQPPQPVAWAPGTEWEVAAGMFDIFHKLPPQAKKFLETQGERPGIVVLTIGLEESLPKLPGAVIPSKLWSPYRLPLIRFLNQYPAESVTYFLESPSRLANDCYFARLLDIVRRPEGAALLKALSEAEGQLAAVFAAKPDADPEACTAAQLNCIHLVHTMAKLMPGWLPEPLYKVALERWRSPEFKSRLASASFLPLAQRLESKWLAKIILSYIEQHHNAFNALFDLMVVFSSPMAIDFTFLKSFIARVTSQGFSLEEKRQILSHWLAVYRMQELDQDQSVNVLRHLINPLVTWTVAHDELDVLSPDIVQRLVMDVFQNPEKGGPSEQIQLELVQLCTTLIQHAHALFQDHRKELIQFGWWTLKYDNIAKPYAFLCVAHFFRAFPTPEKIMLQVYVALCRLSQLSDPAAKEAVRKGIDIMIPNLARAAAAEMPGSSAPGTAPIEVGDSVASKDSTTSGAAASAGAPAVGSAPGATGTSSSPSYARYLKRVLSEDGHVSITLVHLLQVIVRNRDMFYQSRVLFMTTMLNVITRLGLPGNSTLENRYLSVDIASTLFYWDHLAAQDAAQTAGESAGPQVKQEAEQGPPIGVAALQPTTEANPAADADQASRWADASRLTPGMSEMIVNFLLRMAFVSCDPRDRDEAGWRKLHKHCMQIIADAGQLCKPCTLKLHYFEKFLAQNLQHQAGAVQPGQAQASQEPVAALMTGLHIADVYMEHQPEMFIECCAMQLAIMLEPALVSPSPAPVRLLSSVMRRLVSLFPLMPPSEQPKSTAADLAGKLQVRLQEYINRVLAGLSDPSKPLVVDAFAPGCNCLVVMQETMKVDPDCMKPLIGPLLRAMHRLAKEHNQAPAAGLLSAKADQPAGLRPTEAAHGSGSWFMWNALDVAVPSALTLSADHRKHFLSTLVMLITGQSVRAGTTDPSILHLILTMLRKWLLDPSSAHLTAKELLVIIQRIAQLDRMHAIPVGLKPVWDKDFLALLYDTITQKPEDEFGNEVFNRVERTFCCGLQSGDPAVRKKFFRLYADRVPANLFDRLRYIIQGQDWDFIAHTFWLKHGVALLFDSLYLADGITLAYNSAYIPSLFGMGDDPGTPTRLVPDAEQQPKESQAEDVEQAQANGSGSIGAALTRRTSQGRQASDTAVESRLSPAAIPDALQTLLRQCMVFMQEQSSIGSETLVTCLIELVQNGPAVAHHLWVLLFPIVWSSLQKEQQTALAKPIIQLLAKEHHTRQAVALRPTVGQTLLEGISQSQPQPKIPAEMIKYMGRHVHAWHIAISMLEGHVVLFPNDMRCFDALCHLYRALAEDDMAFGLWHRRAAADDTRVALALRQHGFLTQAQLQFLELMGRGVSGGIQGMTKIEMLLWHQQYLACCAELNQWDTVVEYAKVTDNCPLQIDSMVQLHDWQNLKAMVLPKAQIEDNADATIVRAQMHLQELQVVDVDRICKQAMHQAVQQWWNMPEGNPWCYTPVLHTFQRIVELQESWRIMVEFNTHGGAGQQYQEHKDICETWKLRTPNEWEPIQWWSQLLSWRNQVYNLTIRQFGALQSIAPNMHQMGYRDKAWSVNRLGRIARLHHQPEACVQIINTLYGFNAMEVQQAFVKVQEQAKAFLQKPEDHMQGLNLINSTNLDYFSPQHQAEILNLKAQFFAALGDGDAAHSMFSEALTLWPLCWEAWMAWGEFCDGMYEKSKEGHWLEFLATCYLQAIRLASTDARDLVPRLLQLLMVEPKGAEMLGRAVGQKAADLPGWIWLPWIPQLMTSLQRPEVAVARRILSAAASAFPQQLYWHVRPSLLAMKDAAIKAVQDAKAQVSGVSATARSAAPAAAAKPPPGPEQQEQGRPPSPQIEKPIEVMAYEACRDVMEALRAKYSGPLQVLDHFMTEVGQRFSTRTEERLLAVVYTLQQRTYKTGLPASAPVPDVFKKELAGVCKACGSRDAAGAAKLAHFQQQFAKDLDPASPAAPQTLGDMTDRLKGWRMLLESMIDHEYPQTMKMEVEAPTLVDMSLEEMEMPGQHLPAPDAPDMVYVDRLGSNLQVARRNSTSCRRIMLHGSDGSLHMFLVQSSQATTGSEERIQAMLRSANARLLAHSESRRRLLQFKAPAVLVPVQGVRMVEDDISIVPFSDAYDTHCARYGREADAPILAFKARCCTPEGITGDGKARLEAYQQVLSDPKTGVTENIFSQFMYKTMVENNLSMWVIKKQFALSAAMSAVACHMLLLTGRSPSKLLVSRSMGTITHADLTSTYDSRFQLERGHETVPFRLTRNMQSFIGPQGMEGMVVCAITAAAQALQAEQGITSSMVALFFRDDILSWAARRSGARCIAALNASLKTTQLETCVAWNSASCMNRMGVMAPAREGHPQQGTRALVAEAVAPANLCRMCPTWQPWL